MDEEEELNEGLLCVNLCCPSSYANSFRVRVGFRTSARDLSLTSCSHSRSPTYLRYFDFTGLTRAMTCNGIWL